MTQRTHVATVELPISAVSLLVMPAKDARRKSLLHAYPVDLGQTLAEVTDELAAIGEIERVETGSLEIVGLEFADPEQHNTSVTLGTGDLADVEWLIGDMGLGIRGTDSRVTLRNLDKLSAIEVPVYA